MEPKTIKDVVWIVFVVIALALGGREFFLRSSLTPVVIQITPAQIPTAIVANPTPIPPTSPPPNLNSNDEQVKAAFEADCAARHGKISGALPGERAGILHCHADARIESTGKL